MTTILLFDTRVNGFCKLRTLYYSLGLHYAGVVVIDRHLEKNIAVVTVAAATVNN